MTFPQGDNRDQDTATVGAKRRGEGMGRVQRLEEYVAALHALVVLAKRGRQVVVEFGGSRRQAVTDQYLWAIAVTVEDSQVSRIGAQQIHHDAEGRLARVAQVRRRKQNSSKG
jgi:hypothetical protein